MVVCTGRLYFVISHEAEQKSKNCMISMFNGNLFDLSKTRARASYYPNCFSHWWRHISPRYFSPNEGQQKSSVYATVHRQTTELFFSVKAIFFGQSTRTPPNKRGVEFDQDVITHSINELDIMKYPSESNKNFAVYPRINLKGTGIGVLYRCLGNVC